LTPDNCELILKKLEAQRKEEGEISLLLEFYEKLIQIYSRVSRQISVSGRLDPQSLDPAIKQGLPLVSFAKVTVNWSLLPEVFSQVIAVFDHYPDLFGVIPKKWKLPGAGNTLTEETVREWLAEARLPATLSARGASKALLPSVIQAAVKPFLSSLAQMYIDSIDPERWRRNYCPICGGVPDFAYLDRERGSRWLICSQCDTEWLFQRLQCPFCGTEDQKALAYFTDDKGLYRLYICERCQQYLKAIDLRQTDGEVLLPLERFYTLDLDQQAQQRGYRHYIAGPGYRQRRQ